MRKFLGKCLLLALFLLTLTLFMLKFSTHETLGPVIAKLTGSTEYLEGYNQGPIEILPYIDKVRTKDSSTKLILGDSVCFRMFSELQDLNPDYCIAGSNRGVTMSGQYILLHEYLKNHKDATDVYLILIEDSLLTTYETGYGYQYAVMPFVMTKNIDLLDEQSISDMKHTYGGFMLRRKSVFFINESAFGKKMYLNLLNKLKPVTSTYDIPDVANRYIPKMHELCDKNNVTLHLIASPLTDTKERHEIEPILRKNYENSEIYKYFPNYFDQIHYYDASEFSDGVHPSVSRERLDEMIRDMKEASDALSDLTLPSDLP